MALTTEDKKYIQETVNDSIEKLAVMINESFQATHQRFDVLEIQVGNLASRVSKNEAQIQEMDKRLSNKIDLLFDAVAYRADDTKVVSTPG